MSDKKTAPQQANDSTAAAKNSICSKTSNQNSTCDTHIKTTKPDDNGQNYAAPGVDIEAEALTVLAATRPLDSAEQAKFELLMQQRPELETDVAWLTAAQSTLKALKSAKQPADAEQNLLDQGWLRLQQAIAAPESLPETRAETLPKTAAATALADDHADDDAANAKLTASSSAATATATETTTVQFSAYQSRAKGQSGGHGAAAVKQKIWPTIAMAACLLLAVQTLLPWFKGSDSDNYRLAADPATAVSEWQVIVKPECSIAELNALLLDLQLVIVNGPGATGVYQLQPLQLDASSAASTAQLQLALENSGIFQFVSGQ